MEMVLRRVVRRGRMLVTRRTDRVAVVLESHRMRIVAVGTPDVLVIHLALDERSELVVFIHDLPVGVVRGRFEQLIVKVVVILVARPEIRVQHAPPRVAWRTRLDLGSRVGAFEPGQAVPALAIPEPGAAPRQLHAHP